MIEQIETTSPMQKEFNKGMMVAYINKHLPTTAHLDVRKSFVYYDADKDFVVATENFLEGPGADAAFEKLGIKYWSKGIV